MVVVRLLGRTGFSWRTGDGENTRPHLLVQSKIDRNSIDGYF